MAAATKPNIVFVLCDNVGWASTWQDEFPWQNQLLAGYERSSPVKHFRPNGYGLFRDHVLPVGPSSRRTPSCSPQAS